MDWTDAVALSLGELLTWAALATPVLVSLGFVAGAWWAARWQQADADAVMQLEQRVACLARERDDACRVAAAATMDAAEALAKLEALTSTTGRVLHQASARAQRTGVVPPHLLEAVRHG